MMQHKNFAAFIFTHGRPHNCVTYQSLRKHGYTGRVYIIIDNEDETADEYRKVYGDENVIMFDKSAAAQLFDIGDTQADRRAVVFARNASFGIARDLGLEHFLQLDDDYQWFGHRWLENGLARGMPTKFLDLIFDAMLDFLEDTGAATVAMSQGGDHFGGMYLRKREFLLRKAMNSYFFRTDRPLEFLGRMNDDVNCYVVHGAKGTLFLTPIEVSLTPRPTQAASGGMTDMYLESGTYMKSMYSVMMAPSCVEVRTMGSSHPRLHHHITWENAVPKIISEQHRKP